MGSCTWFIFWFSVLCCLSQTACAGTAKKFTSTDAFPDGDIYETGPYKVQKLLDVTSKLICCPLLVAMPEDKGEYPVAQFQHGTALRNTDYSELISRIASWGFIVVAPQMYTWPSLDAKPEIEKARAILSWMQTGLVSAMPGALATPDFNKVALVGHSRGGLVVFGLALGDSNSRRQYSAVVGLDPVDGKWPTSPIILTHKENSLDVGVPTLILGTGLGPKGFKACAPEYQGHKNFYRDVEPPSFHFVAPEYGHMDFTNDNCKPVTFSSLGCNAPCKSGSSRQPMRNFTGGILVAFLQKVLLHNSSAFDTAYNHTELAPISLNLPESKGKISSMPTSTNNTATKTHQYSSV